MPRGKRILNVIAWLIISVNIILLFLPFLSKRGIIPLAWGESIYYSISSSSPALFPLLIARMGIFVGMDLEKVALSFYFIFMIGIGIGLLKRNEWSRKTILFLQFIQMAMIGCFFLFFVLMASFTHFHPKTLIFAYLGLGLVSLIISFLPALVIFVTLRRKEIKLFFE